MANQQNQITDLSVVNLTLAVYIAHYQDGEFHAAVVLNGKYLTSVHLKTNELGDLHGWMDSRLPSPSLPIRAWDGRPVKGDGWCPDLMALHQASLRLGLPDCSFLSDAILKCCQKEADKSNRAGGYYELGYQA